MSLSYTSECPINLAELMFSTLLSICLIFLFCSLNKKSKKGAGFLLRPNYLYIYSISVIVPSHFLWIADFTWIITVCNDMISDVLHFFFVLFTHLPYGPATGFMKLLRIRIQDIGLLCSSITGILTCIRIFLCIRSAASASAFAPLESLLSPFL